MAILSIPDNIYERIITCIGYPIISESDLGLTRDQISDLLILPALKDTYYKWFPITEKKDYEISISFEIDFPDANTFGVIDSRLVWKGTGSALPTGNPLINERYIKVRGQSGRNMWDSGNDYGYTQVYYAERSLSRSQINDIKALKQWVDYANRKLKGHTNTTAKLSVTWAKYSDDWTGVQFKFQEDVIKLAQSYILKYFGNLLNQGTADLPTELDGNNMIDQSETLYEEVITKFKQYTKPVLLR
ncbi:MAG: hypothetical protein ACOC3V_03500 [bacterium]